jgi:hypothetical protein
MRKVQPYGVYQEASGPPLPTDAPTLATREVASGGDTPANAAIRTTLQLHAIEPVQAPYAGQGAVFPAFPLAQPSRVAPNHIGAIIGVARNLFSPVAHSNPLADRMPAKSRVPQRKQGSVPTGRRGTGGAYTIPNPLSTPSWPTSGQWLRDRSNAGIPT